MIAWLVFFFILILDYLCIHRSTLIKNTFFPRLTVMQEAHINLAQQDPKKCLEILPKFFLNATKCWRSDRGEVSVAATAAIKAILNEALRPNLSQLATKDPHDCQNKIKDVFTSVENGLTYQFYDSWAQVPTFYKAILKSKC